MPEKAFITGITGQDGSCPAVLWLAKGCAVPGLLRRTSTFQRWRIDPLGPEGPGGPALHLHYRDMAEGSSLARRLARIQPDELYHLAAQSHVPVSFDMPEDTTDSVATGTVRLLEAIGEVGLRPRCYQASSREMFGRTGETPQCETTPFHPRNLYAGAKVHAYWITVNCREAYGPFAGNGILLNPQSPCRSENFVTRKISRTVARIAAGKPQKLKLGNFEARRNWGKAPEYVQALWLMRQQPEPGDYVIATGAPHSVRESFEVALAHASLDWREHVVTDLRYHRPAGMDVLMGGPSRARRVLGWTARTRFTELARLMVDADRARLADPSAPELAPAT